MPTPLKVPSQGPLEPWTIRVTERTRRFLRDAAKAEEMSVGQYLDRAFGGPNRGGWNR